MKEKKYWYTLLFFFLSILFGSTNLFAQSNWWMQRAGGVTLDEAYDISVDANGNTYATGYFTSSATFGTTTLNSSGVTDIFIAKLDNLGVYQWAVKAGGSGSDRALSIKADAMGNSYITGFFYGTATFGNQTITSSGMQDLFIAKYDNAGVLQWVKSAGGSNADIGNGINVDNSGNVVVTGEFAGTANFGNFSLSSLYNSIDVFTTKLDAVGNFLWAKGGSAKFTDKGLDVACDASGNVYVTGQYSDTITFDVAHNNNMFNAIFLVKYNSGGQEQWFRKIGGGAMNIVSGIVVDANSNVYLTGDFTGGIIFFGTPNTTLTNTYVNKIFVAKYDNGGVLQWAQADGSSNNFTSKNIAVDAIGNTYIIGNFKCILNDYADQYGQGAFNSVGFWDIFVSKYNASGTWQWSRQCGATENDYGWGIAVNSTGQVHIAGSFYKKMTFPFSTGFIGYLAYLTNNNGTSYCNENNYNWYLSFNSSGSSDILIAKNFDPAEATYDYYTRTGTACDKPYIGVCINGPYHTDCHDTITLCSNYSDTPIFAKSNTNDNNAGPDFNYLWSTGATTNNIYVTTSGYYSVKQTSDDGCFVSSDTVYVIVNPVPQESTIGVCINGPYLTDCPDTIALCSNYTLILANSNTNAGPDFGYLWSTGATTNNIYVTTSGYYSVIQTSASAEGCFVSSDTVYVIVNPVPQQPTISDDVIINTNSQYPDPINLCAPDSTQLTGGNFGIYSYEWSGVNLPSDGLAVQSITVSTSGIYYFTVTDSNGCSTYTSISVNLYPGTLPPFLPKTVLFNDPDFNDSTKTCNCFTIQLYDSVSNPTALQTDLPSLLPYTTYTTWTVSPSIPYSNIINTYGQFCPTSSGTYTITARIVRANFCVADTFYVNKTVYVDLLPNLTITGNTVLCPGDSILLTVSGGDGNTYNWDGGQFVSTNSVMIHQPGLYSVSGANSCYGTFYVTMSPLPTVTMNPSSGIVCPSDSVQLSCDGSGTFIWHGPSGTIGGNSSTVYVNEQGNYYCIRTDPSGCTLISNTVEISQYATPSLFVTSSTVLCAGDSIIIAAIASLGSILQWQSPLSGSGSQQTIKNPGTYSCLITSCGIQSLISITITSSTITAQITASGPLTFCGGDSVVLSGNTGVSSYLWQPGSFSQPALNVFQSGTYSLTTTDSYNCTATATIAVTVLDAAVSLFSVSNICLHDSVVFNNISVPGTAGWSWNFGDGSPLETTQHPKHIYAGTGTYNVSLMVTIGNGCNDTLTKSVVIHPHLLDAQFSTANVCNKTTAQFIDGSGLPASDTIYSWTWNFGDGSPLNTNQNNSHLYAADGSYNVQLLVVDNSGCSDSITKTILVHQNPVSNFSFTKVCHNNATQFTDTSTTALGTINTWSWSFGDSSPPNNTQNTSHIFVNAGYHSVKLIVNNSIGCADTITKAVEVYHNPTTGFTYSNVCFRDTMYFTNTSLIDTSSSIADYLWNFGDASPTGGLQNPNHYYSGVGIYTVTLVTTTVDGCSNASTNSVNAFDPPISNFTVNNTCLTYSALFTNSSLSPVWGSTGSWAWDFGDGSALNTSVWSPGHQYLASGTYLVTLTTYSSNLACPDTLSGSITILPTPIANFGFANVCLNEVMTFNDLSMFPSGGISSRSWNFGDGTSPNGNTNPTHMYLNHGTYPVSLIVTGNNGCKDTVTKTTEVHPNPNTQFSAANVCDGTSVDFNDLSSIPSSDTLQSWKWNFGDGSPANLFQSVMGGHLYGAVGSYTVQLTVVSNFGCSDSITKVIVINPNPTVSFVANDTAGCELFCADFEDHSSVTTGANVQWIWSFGDGSYSVNSQNSNHCYSNGSVYSPISFNLNLTVTSDSGCVSILSKTNYITVYPFPVAAFSLSSTDLELPFDVMICNNQSAGASTYSWDFGNGETSTLENPQYLYTSIGVYQVQLISMTQFGCLDTAYSEVTTNVEVIFPNAFSPNPDGTSGGFFDINSLDNNIFFPYTLWGVVVEYKLGIYNRWGEMIFETQDAKQGWDGYYKGKLCPQGVYVWNAYVKLNSGKVFNKTGNVTLLR